MIVVNIYFYVDVYVEPCTRNNKGIGTYNPEEIRQAYITQQYHTKECQSRKAPDDRCHFSAMYCTMMRGHLGAKTAKA